MNFRDILMVAAGQRSGGSAGPTVGPELWPQPAFAASAGLTLGGWIFAPGSVTNSDGVTTYCSATALGTLVAGTYRVAYTVGANPDGTQLSLMIGGSGEAIADWTVGSHSIDIVIASVSTQIIRFRDAVGALDTQLTALSVKMLS